MTASNIKSPVRLALDSASPRGLRLSRASILPSRRCNWDVEHKRTELNQLLGGKEAGGEIRPHLVIAKTRVTTG